MASAVFTVRLKAVRDEAELKLRSNKFSFLFPREDAPAVVCPQRANVWEGVISCPLPVCLIREWQYHYRRYFPVHDLLYAFVVAAGLQTEAVADWPDGVWSKTFTRTIDEVTNEHVR
jgi:hypothetical protein